MPYNYYFNNKRYGPRGRNYRGRYGFNRYRPMRALRSEPESKYFNNNIIQSSTETATTELTGIPAGTGVEGRIGRKIKVMSALCNVYLQSNSPLRCILYVPKQADQELALTEQYQPVDSDQFWVLKDWWQTGAVGNANEDSRNPMIVSHRFPLGLNVEFDGSGAGAFVKNPIKLYTHGNGGTTTVNGFTKVWYKDN